MILFELAQQYSCYKLIKWFDDDFFKFIVRKFIYCRFDNPDDFLDKAKLSIDNNLGKHFIPSKSTHLNEENQEAFDLQTYKKFFSFLKFQEMMDKYSN